MDGSETTTENIAAVPAVELAGTWHLSDCTVTYPNGKVTRPWARSASGCLIYAPDGHVCTSLNYPRLDGRLECRSFCGEYRIVGDRIYHFITVSNDLREIGTVQEQRIALDRDRLTLTAHPAPAGGPGSSVQYIWHRAGSADASDGSTARGFAGKSFNRAS